MRSRLRWRPAPGKTLTFLYVPDDADVRQFRIPRYAIHAGITVLVLGAVLFAAFGVRYLGAMADGRKMLGLQGENEALRTRLAAIEGQLESLNGAMRESRQVQERLRLLASLDPIHEDLFAAGVGGPLVQDDSGTLPSDLAGSIDKTSAHLSQMLRQASLQRDSYEEILDALKAKKDVWDRTPSVRPVASGFITGRFGRRMDPFTGQAAMHRGIDIAAQPGALVRATADGVVTKAGLLGNYGLLVEVNHGDGLASRYAHCSKILVKPGDRVQRGDRIARVGSTGKATGTHVHYEVIQAGLPQDPMKFVIPPEVVVD